MRWYLCLTQMPWPVKSAAGTAGPLAGVKVLDLSAFAVGPWAASCLGALGADVIKVDPPYGDPIRRVRPQRRGEPTTYTICNLGKRAITLDFKDPDSHRLVMQMAAEADIIVENHRAGAMDRLQLGYADVSVHNPGIVYCSSGSYGDRGPMAAVGSTDPHGQAFSGFVAINGVDREHPEFLRYSALVDLCTSTYLVGGALFGLELRARSGTGCHVVTSQMEAAISIQLTRFAEYFATSRCPVPMGSAVASLVPSQAFLCRDRRYLNISAPTPQTWAALCRVLELPELSGDPRFSSNPDRVRHRAELVPLLEAAVATGDLLWWKLRLGEAGVPCAELSVIDDAVAQPKAHPLGRFFAKVPHPVEGSMVTPRPPWDFSRTPASLGPAPRPGADDVSLREAFAKPPTALGADAPAPGGGERELPLAGVRVLELAQGLAGPYCGWLLAGVGAEVLKLETAEGDPLRALGPPFTGQDGAVYATLTRGKTVLPQDWNSPEGTRRLEDLLRRADVVIVDRGRSGFAPGAPFAGQKVPGNPAAVVCGVSPTGEDGPLAATVASELEVQGLSGMLRYLGEIGRSPVRMGADIAGISTGMTAFVGVLGALHERRRSGRGQYVAVSGVGSLVALGAVMIGALERPDAWEGFHCRAAATPPIHGVHTEGGLVSFSAPKLQSDWETFCREIGAESILEDPLYSTDEQRTFRRPELLRDMEPYFRPCQREFIIDLANRLGGIAVPIQDYDDLMAHPQVRAMELVAEDDGRYLVVPWKIDGRRPSREARAGAWIDLIAGWEGPLAPPALTSP